MLPDLPESYYLDNVKTLFDHVEAIYADILDEKYLNFLDRFRQLSDDSQKLIIRLLNRSSHLFRLNKLKYPEINSIPQAIEELSSCYFLQIDPCLNHEDILPLFNKAELIKKHNNPEALKAFNRSELNHYILNEGDELFFENLAGNECLLQVSHRDTYQLLQMLFFGNLNQSMTDFVLRDLGLYQFEKYRIDADNRPYRNAEEIQQHWLLHRLDEIIEHTDPDDSGALLQYFKVIPECVDQLSPVYRKSEHLKYDIARQLERLGNFPAAMSLYQQCQLPPSRERQARIYHQQRNYQQAIKLCLAIIESPKDEAEHQFAGEFAARIIKRNKLEPLPGISDQKNYFPKIIDLELKQQPCVERSVVDYYNRQTSGQVCFYQENKLFNGVLGLLIWKAIFAPVSGAFFNAFQYRPNDYYAFDFLKKRQHLLGPIWASIHSNDDIWQRVSKCWHTKQGLANPLVDWKNLDLDIIQMALQRIPHANWLAIFRRLLLDLRNNRSGFPDLIVFPAERDYLLVEVKGPGDTLQKNQRRWMQYFDHNNIPHCVARVHWLTT